MHPRRAGNTPSSSFVGDCNPQAWSSRNFVQVVCLKGRLGPGTNLWGMDGSRTSHGESQCFSGSKGGSNFSKGAWRGSQVTPIRVVGIRSTIMALEWPCAVKLHPQFPARCPRFSQNHSIAGLGLRTSNTQGAPMEPARANSTSCPSSWDPVLWLTQDAERMHQESECAHAKPSQQYPKRLQC